MRPERLLHGENTLSLHTRFMRKLKASSLIVQKTGNTYKNAEKSGILILSKRSKGQDELISDVHLAKVRHSHTPESTKLIQTISSVSVSPFFS